MINLWIYIYIYIYIQDVSEIEGQTLRAYSTCKDEKSHISPEMRPIRVTCMDELMDTAE